ncbi:CBS domain-containing protein [Nonomuraea soli]|uniref:CBS domain-containing protein n=1 Tax=Nonomuraea soli TaxID=1032476 RepID=A0A7W0CF49_9ACTN|nr:CBS domain-containing protein [Nonomuraea soli]MBA2889998.1 CBS domain-containing protein [Nonomuraea soli]
MRIQVKDVMTTTVAAVNKKAPFHVVAQVLIDRSVSGLPVIDSDDHVVGVVSEADLLCKAEFKERFYGDDYRPPLRARVRHMAGSEHDIYRKSVGHTAGELMSAPAVVATPNDSVVRAARLMDRHGVKRLPVVDAEGRLVGIVSRHDLLKVFTRSDEAIRNDVVNGLPPLAVSSIEVTVKDGVVGLTGQVDKNSQAIAAARHAENVDGVVGLRDELTWKLDDIAANLPYFGGT